MRLDDIEQAGFEDVVDKAGLGQFIAKVHGRAPDVEKRRPSEVSRIVRDEFSIPWEEFVFIRTSELWEGYVKVLLQRVLLRVKAAAKGRVKFFRFPAPASSLNQWVEVYDRGGVYAVLVSRHCAHQTHRDRVTEVAEFSFEVEVGDFDK
jgi:hypothetical protein